MFRLFCKKLLQSSTNLPFLQDPYLRSISNANIQPSFSIDYLRNAFRLSLDFSLKACQKIFIRTNSTSRPESVLALFDTYEFPKPQIPKLITKYPSLLFADPDNTLKPKLDFFSNIGISGPDLANILCRDPSVLDCSLEDHVIPLVNFLKSFIHRDEDMAVVLGRLRLLKGVPELMGPNIEILRGQGFPDSIISELILRRPQLLTWKASRFKEKLLQTKQMGFDTSSSLFVLGFHAVSQMNKPTWEAKLEVFSSFGWSENEILSLFRKQPGYLTRSENIIRTHLNFFMYKLDWTAVEMIENSEVLHQSLEKKVIPKCLVLGVLSSKGLFEKERLGKALKMNEVKFLKKFVMKYEKELPELLNLYKSMAESPRPETGSEEGSRDESQYEFAGEWSPN
ncbi:uncharacterized protein LOC122088179 isoform X2 [Macadamia integrifolia]|uniref:uncharacterized protein LOC122088179 isoform X2 n=1 Tax=Macadamia integrifolia TaxID=60698 RepID=UPI001C4FEADE|nr:uncharacterized protein LOC122088179 isoform X2 [Macadamia integrifolia]